MSKLRDKTTGKTYDVTDVDAQRMSQQDPNLEIVGDTRVVAGSDGNGFTVAGSSLQGKQGLRPETPDEAMESEHRSVLEQRHDNIGSMGKAAVGSTIGGLTLGFAKPFQEDQDYHPYISTAGTIAGALAPALVGDEAGIGALLADTPAGLAARAGEAAGAMVPDAIAGSKTIARIAKGAVGGAGYGAADYSLRSALDDDVQFSGEGLAHSMFVGGALGGGLTAASEAIGAGGRALSQITRKAPAITDAEEAAALKAYRASPQPNPSSASPDWRGYVDMSRSSARITAADAMTAASKDFHSLADAADRLSEMKAMVEPSDLNRLNQLTSDVRYVGQKLELATRNPVQFLGKVASRMDDAQELASIVRKYSPESLPNRWLDNGLTAQRVAGRQAVESEIASRGLGGLDADGLRIANELAVGKDPTASKGLMSMLGGKVLSKVPGGRFLGAIAGGAGLEELIAGSGHHILGAAVHAAPVAAGLAVGAKALQAAFRDPVLGGILSAGTADVLSRTHLFPGDAPEHNRDARVALRSLAERVRRTDPQAVSSANVGLHGQTAGLSPSAAMAAGTAAANRHQILRQELDRIDPPANQAQGLMGRPLPSHAAAVKAADAVRVLSSPAAVLMMAAKGQLSPQALALAERAYPRTVAKLRAQLLSLLPHIDPRSLPHAARRTIETVLGPSILGPSSRSAAYSSMMRGAAQRSAAQGKQQQSPKPTGPTESAVPPSPAQAAAHPGEHR